MTTLSFCKNCGNQILAMADGTCPACRMPANHPVDRGVQPGTISNGPTYFKRWMSAIVFLVPWGALWLYNMLKPEPPVLNWDKDGREAMAVCTSVASSISKKEIRRMRYVQGIRYTFERYCELAFIDDADKLVKVRVTLGHGEGETPELAEAAWIRPIMVRDPWNDPTEAPVGEFIKIKYLLCDPTECRILEVTRKFPPDSHPLAAIARNARESNLILRLNDERMKKQKRGPGDAPLTTTGTRNSVINVFAPSPKIDVFASPPCPRKSSTASF